MTRKENLLIEIYNLRNQIAEIKGNKIVNIDEFSQTRKFRDEAADSIGANPSLVTFALLQQEEIFHIIN